MTLDDAEALIAAGRLAEAEIICASQSSGAESDRARALLKSISDLAKDGAPSDIPESYHRWFYDTLRWKHRTWMGVPTLKSPLDMWSYQEIIAELQPSLVIEFGSFAGGSALFFAHLLRSYSADGRVLSIDVDHQRIDERARSHNAITFIEGSSTDPAITKSLAQARGDCPGVAFFILDSDHASEHVLQELLSLRAITRRGDYLIVEDGNINGHPILPLWGPGPTEALQAYHRDFPDDYTHDLAREQVFGWTFAPGGFLVRR